MNDHPLNGFTSWTSLTLIHLVRHATFPIEAISAVLLPTFLASFFTVGVFISQPGHFLDRWFVKEIA